MTEGQKIADQLRRSLNGPAWHGPSLEEVLREVRPDLVDARNDDAHTIHELVLHIGTWQRFALDALSGIPMPDPATSEDWREPRDWQAALHELREANERLAAACDAMPDEQLGATVPGRDYSVYVLLHGVAQHNAYHGGQIAINCKLLQQTAL